MKRMQLRPLVVKAVELVRTKKGRRLITGALADGALGHSDANYRMQEYCNRVRASCVSQNTKGMIRGALWIVA
jgi:hypothetical protein